MTTSIAATATPSSKSSPRGGATTNVIFVLKRNAKAAKTKLEQDGCLDKQFRMIGDAGDGGDCVAIPINDEYVAAAAATVADHDGIIIGTGTHHCPYSTSVLGNRGNVITRNDLSLLQQTVLDVMLLSSSSSSSLLLSTTEQRGNTTNSTTTDDETSFLIQQIKASKAIPSKLEIIGDDRTIVLSSDAFCCFDESVLQKIDMQVLWQRICKVYKSSRIVRRGPIDANSQIRHSGHRLVWPVLSGVPEETGPQSPGWICVTEQGIRQSFDLTRVMFSRGNISEKIRFGQTIVRPGDEVLDMYAGIGYYTLPAIIHGQAKHVVSCEWNDHAIEALRYNIADNHVEDRVTVLQGDCRIVAQQHNLVNKFDRVSLGLLPSSEGGWKTAVHALKEATGGYLHIHANVPDKERREWLDWTCQCLLEIVDEMERPRMDCWIVACSHLERVKSFAPTISHYVADIYVGPMRLAPNNDLLKAHSLDGEKNGKMKLGRTWVFRKATGTWKPCETISTPPSCALSESGVLCQKWMA